ncbi:hypothetical protein ACP70R_030113 [Stipagrostis hirtigluma subsp. patula]
MAEVGGLLAAAVLKVAAEKVAGMVGDRVMLQWRFGNDLEDMRDTVESVEAVMEDAERRSIEDASVRLWLKRLTRASYDISDMFDEFEVDVTKKSALPKFKVLNPCLTLAPEVSMAGKMKKVREKLEKISNDHHKFSFMAGSSSYMQQLVDERATSAKVKEADILGRDEEKQKLIDLLTIASNSSDVVILPIYGIGGIGKTTLAQLLYNDNHFKDYEKAWVYVSQIFDLEKIGKSIKSQLQKEQSQLTNQKTDSDPLARKKILIVLDDLWEKNDYKLDDLKRSLETVGNECKVHVIVTTRDSDIAQKIQTTEAYEIKPLPYWMCWNIIKQIVGFEDRVDKDSLEPTGIEIAKRCGGVALAARALGYMLRSRNSSGWNSVKGSGLWNLSRSGYTTSPDDTVLASLRLSYSSMLPYQRLCFAYCATFPKDHKMAKDDLIYQWAALGFIKPSDSNTVPIWQDGENCIKQLLGMSFFEHPNSSLSDGKHDDDVTMFIMHDLVRNLARSIMGDEVLDTSQKCSIGEQVLDISQKFSIGGHNCHYVSLADCSRPLNSFVTYPDKIRALRFLGSCKIGQCAARLSMAKYLRVLDLGECSIQKLPSSVGRLKLLRYLNAPGIKDRTIPSCITKLSKLIYLNLRGSSMLSALPDSIGEMKSLMYLDVSGCSEISELPKSFGKLKNLVHLDFSKCSNVRGVSKFLGNLTQLKYLNLSYCRNIGEVQVGLGSLIKLQYLNLSCSSYFTERSDGDVLGTLTNLEYLNLSSTEASSLKTLPEALGRFTELKYLNLSGRNQLKELPRSFGKLRNLVNLDLSDCSHVHGVPVALKSLTKLRYLNLSGTSRYLNNEDKPPLFGLPEAIAELNELWYLNLSHCLSHIWEVSQYDICDDFFDRISILPNLVHLVLSENGLLRTIPDSILRLSKLQTLDLTGCSSLRWLPNNIGYMDSLKFLFVSGCPALDKSTLRMGKSLISPNFVVENAEGEQSSNLVLLKDENPLELEISCLENVKSLEEAQRIKLREKQSMIKLALDWTRGKKGYVEDMELSSDLMPPSSLEEFELRGYNSVSFPAWLLGIAYYLPNLLTVKLAGLPQCRRLPPLGQLPKLKHLYLEAMPNVTKIDSDFCGGVNAFVQLEELSISNMESLEEWTTSYSYAEDVALEFMFPNLETLTIQGCRKLRVNPRPPRVKSFWQIIDSDGVLFQWGDRASHTAPSTSSALEDGLRVESFPDLLALKIDSDRVLFQWEDNAPHTAISTSSALVNDLRVKSCMAPMHKWKLLHHLPALNKLTIEDCIEDSNDPSCPLAIDGALCSLRNLHLTSLASLPQWLGGLTSLQRLGIKDCPSLNNLPESMQNLSSLQTLVIEKCPSLNNLPESMWHLSSLQILKIEDCPNLNNLSESMRHLSSLQDLHLYRCTGIQALPQLLGDLCSLEKLEIMDCPNLNNLPESMRYISSLKSLYLIDCVGIEALPECLGDLTSLQILSIWQCPRLNKLPESIWHLSSLHTLSLDDCGGIQALPERLGDAVSLKHLRIIKCAGIVSLPESIQKLTNLEELYISCCPALEQWCNLEENKTKIADINKV